MSVYEGIKEYNTQKLTYNPNAYNPIIQNYPDNNNNINALNSRLNTQSFNRPAAPTFYNRPTVPTFFIGGNTPMNR